MIGLTFVVLLGLVWLADWRFHFSIPTLSTRSHRDRGFRLAADRIICQNERLERGQSRGFIGPCGLVIDENLQRFKLINHVASGLTFRNSSIENFLMEWFEAPSSIWESTNFSHGDILEGDFRHSSFKKVVFKNVSFIGTRWSGSRFEDCTFLDSTFRDVLFRSVTFVRTDFKNVTCQNCDFRSAKFQDSTIDSNFQEAMFNENTVLPFSIDEAGAKGFEYRAGY